MRKRFYIIILLIMSARSYFSSAEGDTFLRDLIQEALSQNPQIRALKAEWEAKEAKVLSEKMFPQPQIRLTYVGEAIQTKVGPQDRKYGVTQRMPFPTKLHLKGKIASKESEIAYIKYLLKMREVIRDLKTAFYDYYFVLQAIRILQEEKLILQSMSKAIQRKYESLKAPQQDLVKAHLEIARIEDKILSFEKYRNFLKAQLNQILNRPEQKEIFLPEDYQLQLDLVPQDKDSLLEKALQGSPLVLVDRLGIEKQALKLSLTSQEYLPDFALMADYVEIGEGSTNLENDGKDAWMVSLGITLPIWFWKINSDIKSEKSKLESQKGRYEEKENFLAFKVEDLHFKLDTNYQLIDLYRNVIVPQAEQNFSTSRIAYESGLVDFLNWLDAERNLINLKIAAIKQEVEYKKTIAELEYIVGEDLE